MSLALAIAKWRQSDLGKSRSTDVGGGGGGGNLSYLIIRETPRERHLVPTLNGATPMRPWGGFCAKRWVNSLLMVCRGVRRFDIYSTFLHISFHQPDTWMDQEASLCVWFGGDVLILMSEGRVTPCFGFFTPSWSAAQPMQCRQTNDIFTCGSRSTCGNFQCNLLVKR